MTVCAAMLKQGPEIDPQAASPFLTLFYLDTLAIYEHRIWMLFKDVCKESMVKTLAVLRASQLGIIDRTTLNYAIDNRGAGIDTDALLQTVKEQLNEFDCNGDQISGG